jgi:hypothetical protein
MPDGTERAMADNRVAVAPCPEDDIADLVNTLSAEDQRKILRDNAARLFERA